ncbi:MAG: DUF4382 domain-containing protein, partial [Planctomycetota bacterium]
TLLFLTAGIATAAGASQGYLTRPADGPDDDARGTVKVKDSPGTSLFSIKLKKVDRDVTYTLWIEDEDLWVKLGETLGRKKWKANTARGDELPLGADTAADLAGLSLQVRDGDDEVVLVGIVPDATDKKKTRKQKGKLTPPDPVPFQGDVQADDVTVRVRVRKAEAGDYDVFLEGDDEEMSDIGDLVVGSNGSGLWTICAKKGDTTPLGCDGYGDLSQRRIQVRDGEGEIVLEGEIPGEREPKSSGPSGQGPRLRILVTDAPFPFDDVKSAIVSVKRVEIREVDSPFETLMEWDGGRELDLVQLKNGLVNILYAGDPEPGDYDALRIIVEPVEITILDDGVEKTFTKFKVPSGAQTGIKVYVKPAVSVVTDLTKDIVLDFDLGNSFIVQGNPKTPAGIKGFHFKPVIRAVNRTTAGSLTFRVMSDNGTPLDDTDDFHIDGADWKVIDTTVTPNVTLASGASGTNPDDASESGYVFHPGVTAGTFKLEVAYRYHDTHEQRSTIYAGNLTDEGTIVLVATAGYIEGSVTTSITTKDGDEVSFILAGATVSGALSTDATVTASDTTNALGEYQLTDLDLGTWNLTASMTGYVDATGSTAAIVPGDPNAADYDLELTPATAAISGTVTDDTDTAVSGATVKLVFQLGDDDYLIAETTTDVDGKYSFATVGTGSYEVTASITVLEVTSTGSASVTHVGPTASTADIEVAAPADDSPADDSPADDS